MASSSVPWVAGAFYFHAPGSTGLPLPSKQGAALRLATAELQHLPCPWLRRDPAQCRSSRLPRVARPLGRTPPPPGQCNDSGSATPGAEPCPRRSSKSLRRSAQVSRGQPSQVGLSASIGVRASGAQACLLVQHKAAWLNSMACHCSNGSHACSAPSTDAMNRCCLAGLSRYAMDFQVGGACRACSMLLQSMPDLLHCAAVLKICFDHVPAVQQSLPDECRRSGLWARGGMAWWSQPSTGDHSSCCTGRPGCKPLRVLRLPEGVGLVGGAVALCKPAHSGRLCLKVQLCPI